MAKTPCFGIDLGTTCSAIGLVRDGVPQIFLVDGSELLPSVLFAKEDGAMLVGQEALNALALDPSRGVLSSKRYMGTEHVYRLGTLELRPVDVATHILRRLAEAAFAATGIRPERVVITVPAWFTQAQRADTKKAGEQAGFQVERIINEPTAAALAHAHGQPLKRRVLVYDFGGGTFDVSLVEQDGPIVEVRASHGDSRLGGDDIDLALVDRVLRRLAETDRPLRDAVDASLAARIRLQLAVEKVKVILSEVVETTLRIPFLVEVEGKPAHLEMVLTRSDVEEAATPFLERSLRSVDQVLGDTSTTARQLDELLLVGGSTLQPLVWHTLHERYGLQGSHAIPPRRAVVLGAAIQGAILDGSRTDGILVDVAPYSLSVGVATGGYMPTHFRCEVLTPRNAPLPARHSTQLRTVTPMQDMVELPIFQGSSIDPRKNAVLGFVRLTGIPPAPAGAAGRPIRVEFRHDLDGMVDITVTDVLSEKQARGKVAADGTEQAELRRRVEKHWEHLIPMEEPDQEPEEWQPEPASPPPSSVQERADQAEARQVFQAVLAGEGGLQAEHPDLAEALLKLARDGQIALDMGSAEEALPLYDQLSDLLFDQGIYL